MVERLLAAAGRFDEDAQVVLELVLAHELRQGLGAQGAVERLIVAEGPLGQDAFVAGTGHSRLKESRTSSSTAASRSPRSLATESSAWRASAGL